MEPREGGRPTQSPPSPLFSPPPPASPGRGSPAPRQSAGPPVAPASGTCGEGLHEVRGGGSGDPTPCVRTRLPGRLLGAGSAGFKAQGAASRTLLPAGRPSGKSERGSSGVVEISGGGGAREAGRRGAGRVTSCAARRPLAHQDRGVCSSDPVRARRGAGGAAGVVAEGAGSREEAVGTFVEFCLRRRLRGVNVRAGRSKSLTSRVPGADLVRPPSRCTGYTLQPEISSPGEKPRLEVGELSPGGGRLGCRGD